MSLILSLEAGFFFLLLLVDLLFGMEEAGIKK